MSAFHHFSGLAAQQIYILWLFGASLKKKKHNGNEEDEGMG